jgi:hypothetical protein
MNEWDEIEAEDLKDEDRREIWAYVLAQEAKWREILPF